MGERGWRSIHGKSIAPKMKSKLKLKLKLNPKQGLRLMAYPDCEVSCHLARSCSLNKHFQGSHDYAEKKMEFGGFKDFSLIFSSEQQILFPCHGDFVERATFHNDCPSIFSPVSSCLIFCSFTGNLWKLAFQSNLLLCVWLVLCLNDSYKSLHLHLLQPHIHAHRRHRHQHHHHRSENENVSILFMHLTSLEKGKLSKLID